MKISVIIPTFNAEAYLGRLLPMLEEQSIEFELLIIDSSSTDNTIAMAKPYARTIVTLPQNQFDHGGTRTQIAKVASGDILIFLTQDILPLDKDTFKNIIQVFENPKVAAAYGRQLPYAHTNIFGTHLRLFNYPPNSHIRSLDDKKLYGIKTAFLSDSFAAYRKSAMEEVGYFKNGLILGEDAHIGAKLLLHKHSLTYVADSAVYHSHSYTPIEEFRRYFDIGVFHTHEAWMLETFGKVEGEGKRYIKSEFAYLLKEHAFLKIPEFFVRNGLKLLGYKLGRKHQLLPHRLVLLLSMHRHWWERNQSKESLQSSSKVSS